MKLKVLGSSSSGNCYLLESDTECLIIESGVPLKEVKIALDFDFSKIVGFISSHKHSDHDKYSSEYVKAGIMPFRPFVCTEHVPTAKFGKFLIKAFPNKTSDGKWLHNDSDGSECPCYGFWIYEPSMGKLVYDSDTECIVQRFNGINHFLIEANYSQELVDKEEAKFRHQISGHMEINTTCDFIRANKSPELRNIFLCHLSSENGSESDFISKVKEICECDVKVAKKGLCKSIDLLPF